MTCGNFLFVVVGLCLYIYVCFFFLIFALCRILGKKDATKKKKETKKKKATPKRKTPQVQNFFSFGGPVFGLSPGELLRCGDLRCCRRGLQLGHALDGGLGNGSSSTVCRHIKSSSFCSMDAIETNGEIYGIFLLMHKIYDT